MASIKQKIKKSYNILAQEYFEARKEGGASQFYNEMLEMPATLKLLGNIKGKRILDMGCGPGIYSRILTEKGAKVVGIDNSEVSLSIAKKEAPKAEFIPGDIEKLPFKSGEFDTVLAALVLGHFKDWSKIFKEVKRVLKDGGIFVFSTNNPIEESAIKKRWFGKTFKIVKDYFNERTFYTIWGEKKTSSEVSHHHKTYATIIRYIINNGFEIIDYEDAKPLAKSKYKYPDKYAKFTDFPKFCSWKLKKK